MKNKDQKYLEEIHKCIKMAYKDLKEANVTLKKIFVEINEN